MVNTNIKIIRDEKEDIESQIVVDKWILYILISIVVFVPLIVLGHVTNVVSPLIDNKIQLQSGPKVDIFTHYKNILLVVLTSSALVLFLYKLYFLNYQLPRRRILWFFVIYIIGILFSTLLSESIKISLFGQYNRSDGAISYLCYIILMFIAMNIQYPTTTIKYVLYSFYPFIIINFILSVMNFLGNDALKYEMIQKIISAGFSEGVEINEESMLLGTLNHWNYMSGMFSILTILYLTLVLIDSNFKAKIINLFFAFISVTTMLIAMSASGFVTLVAMIPFVIWIGYKSLNRKSAFVMLMLFGVVSGGIIHLLSSENPEAWDESIGFFLPMNPYLEDQPLEQTSNREDNPSPLNLSFLIGSTANAAANFSLPELPESSWGPGTGRIYIWTETIKLLKERPLFGYGLDTLIYNFPHYNLEARENLVMVTIVDKPHSFYVGILYGTGIIGFIGFLGIILPTIFTSIKSIYRFNISGTTVILCVAWLAFLVQALFNDSLPGTTGPMFVVGGIMMGLLYKKNEKEETI